MFRDILDVAMMPESDVLEKERCTRVPFRSAIQRLYHARKIFFTWSGYMGLAAGETKIGDKVAIMAGAKMALLLRKPTDGRQGYLLVGDAYVRGCTYGEAVDETELEEIELI